MEKKIGDLQRKEETMSNFEEILSGLCVADNEKRRAAEAAYEV